MIGCWPPGAEGENMCKVNHYTALWALWVYRSVLTFTVMTFGLFLIKIFQHKVQQNLRKITTKKRGGFLKTVRYFKIMAKTMLWHSEVSGNMKVYSVKQIYCASVNKPTLYVYTLQPCDAAGIKLWYEEMIVHKRSEWLACGSLHYILYGLTFMPRTLQ